MNFKEKYKRESFLHFLNDFLPSDVVYKDEEIIITSERYKEIKKAGILGYCESLDLHVMEMDHSREKDPRITIATDAFKILADHWIHKALVIFKNKDTDNYRFSYLTISLDLNEKNKPIKKYSSARRYSFYLGPGAKINTPTKFLITRGRIVDSEDLKNRFSIEVVNKEFYKEISQAFTQLVGGDLYSRKSTQSYSAQLKLPSSSDHSKINLEFAVRLIGRIIFCWFLHEKKSDLGHSLMPTKLVSLRALLERKDYYHNILEPIFFEVLNKPIKSRKEAFSRDLFSEIPYLNGGLFSPHEDDYFSYNENKQAINHNTVIVPDEWLKSFFEVLETYNFTIDENTSYDEELSIDPEMLGRIFENLLAEINPETGDTARKSTGSYYTPRKIVDYMIDESLFLYLKDKTNISQNKLQSLISYDLIDDTLNPLTNDDKEKVAKALSAVKILDPACGSGAFPIGALQKIVFILQQIDPKGQLWFKNQIQNTPVELRRFIEKEFKEKNFDYLRKLGIIRENIYGIDLQPIATEISRLRCFLTLVVDEHIDDALENRGVEPLPNLDFKFVTANTLIGLPQSGKEVQMGMFEDEAGISELKEIRNMFFNASGYERDQLKLQFVQTQNRMFQRLIKEGLRNHAELTSKLTSWDPFSHKSSDWFDPEWMYGVQNGFDIVIANPPYISFYSKQSQANRKDLEMLGGLIDKYSFIKNKRKLGRFNTLMFFIEKGITLLKKDSILNYIVDTNIHSNPSQDIREYLINGTQLIHVVDNLREFENVASSQAILLIKNTKVNSSYKTSWKKYSQGSFITEKSEDIENINAGNNFSFKMPNNSNINKILDKISRNISLSSLVENENIRTCITFTGKKDKFVISEAQNDIDFPLLEGSYSLPFPYAPIQWRSYIRYDTKLRDKLNEDYKKLAEFEGKRSPMVIGLGDLDRFKAPKIFIRLSDKRITGTYTDKFLCADLSLYILTLPSLTNSWNSYSLQYLLGIINSKLITFYFIKKNLIRNLLTGTPQIRLKDLRSLPVATSSIVNKDKVQSIEQIVNKILTISNSVNYINNTDKVDLVKQLEKEIDKTIYCLYGLTDEEIIVVEETSK